MNEKINQLIAGPIATNCWIYKIDDNAAAVIDPGDEADVIISALKDLSLSPKYILLTHGHFDHIGALPIINEQLAMSNEQIEIAIHKLDADYLGPDSYEKHCISAKAAIGDTSIIDAIWPKDKSGNVITTGMPAATRLLNEGDSIGPFTVLHLPGHTPGSCAFWDKEAKVIFTGDTLFKSGFGRTDLPEGNDKDLIASLRRLFALDAGLTVCPGHGGVTTIGQEAR